MTVCSFPLALDCAERAATCAALHFRHKHDRGVVSLKAIAYLAPLLGAFGTTKALIEGLVQPP